MRYVRCDNANCAKEDPLSEYGGLPNDWITLTEQGRSGQWNVCSLACLVVYGQCTQVVRRLEAKDQTNGTK